jgi:hypothetical protein
MASKLAVSEQTVTATSGGASIPWPSPDNAEQTATLYITTANGPVRVVNSAGDTSGIKVPDAEDNYACETWPLASNDKPDALYAATNTDCDVTIIVHDE